MAAGRSVFGAIIFATLVLAFDRPASAQTPSGGPLALNAIRRGDQAEVSLRYLPSGRLAAVWASAHYPPDLDPEKTTAFTVARLFSPAGAPQPARRLRNGLFNPVLATGLAPAVSFQVFGLWTSDPIHFGDLAFQGMRFSAVDAHSLAPPVDVEIDQRTSLLLAAARHHAGQTLVMWVEYEDPLAGLFNSVATARILDADDRPMGAPFRLFPGAPADATSLSVANRPDDFIAVGAYDPSMGTGLDVFVQALSIDGDLLGAPVLVNSFLDGHQSAARAATDSAGGYVVVWQSELQDGSFEGIYGQRFDADGSLVGPEFRVNETALSAQRRPDVAMDSAGNFAVTWQSFNPDPDSVENWNIFARLYRNDGTPVSGEIQVNQDGRTNERPRVTFGPFGVLAVAWDSCCFANADGRDVFIRRLLASRGAEPCVARDGHLACDAGRTGDSAELKEEFTFQEQSIFGDLNGDNRDDICSWAHGWLRCDTDHEDEQDDKAVRFGFRGDAILLADWDGDGRDDPCARRGRRFVCDVDRDRIEETKIAFGLETDVALAGDLDGDGRDEFCVVRGALFRCDMDHKGGAAEIEIAFDARGGTPLLGDFDGNGTDDPCMFTEGVFSCDTAHDGGAAEQVLHFGRAGDLPFLPNLDGL